MQGVVPLQDLVEALPKIRVPSLATIPPIWEAGGGWEPGNTPLGCRRDRTSPKRETRLCHPLAGGPPGLRTAGHPRSSGWSTSTVGGGANRVPPVQDRRLPDAPPDPGGGRGDHRLFCGTVVPRPNTARSSSAFMLPSTPCRWTTSLRYIVAFYRRRAGVRGTPKRGSGIALPAAHAGDAAPPPGYPLGTISQVLGHTSSESSTRGSIRRVDLRRASRGVALDPGGRWVMRATKRLPSLAASASSVPHGPAHPGEAGRGLWLRPAERPPERPRPVPASQEGLIRIELPQGFGPLLVCQATHESAKTHRFLDLRGPPTGRVPGPGAVTRPGLRTSKLTTIPA